MGLREIKFRGKSIFGIHEWLYGSLLLLNGKSYICPDKEAAWNMTRYEVIPETVGQFTGLFDKNGKEIYEGDVLLIDEYAGAKIYNKVGIKDGCFGYIGEYSGELLPFCHYNVTEEIAGNIYDHPELIKEEDK